MGLECEVDTDMEIMGVTHAGWVGAPPPMYCGDRNVGYWDHITGLEQNEISYENNGGRSDVRGCCWWGRGGELKVSVITFVTPFVTSCSHLLLVFFSIKLCKYEGCVHTASLITGLEPRQQQRGDLVYTPILIFVKTQALYVVIEDHPS